MSIRNIIAGKKGLGWQADKDDSRDWKIGYLIGSVGLELPAHVDLGKYEPPIFSQGTNNDCVAEALCAAIAIRENALRVDTASIPSRLFVYYNARRLHRMHWIDKGTSIRLACKGIKEIGAPDEQIWKWSQSVARVNKKPSWSAYMAANVRAGLQYYKILSIGAQRLHDMQAALASGYPIVFGMPLPSEFLDEDGPVLLTPSKSADYIGGHAMCVVGYEYIGSMLFFRVRNSWGTDWRQRGYVLLSSEWFVLDTTRDLTIVDGWRSLQ